MNDKPPASAFKDAAEQGANLTIAPDILEWFKQRGMGWQQEIEGVLDFRPIADTARKKVARQGRGFVKYFIMYVVLYLWHER
jgi:hypothetical protein